MHTGTKNKISFGGKRKECTKVMRNPTTNHGVMNLNPNPIRTTVHTTDTYGKIEAEKDYDYLVEFHEVVYQGTEVTAAYTTLAHEAWWRLANFYKTQGNVPLEVMLTLLYTQKYLPSTYDEYEYKDDTPKGRWGV